MAAVGIRVSGYPGIRVSGYPGNYDLGWGGNMPPMPPHSYATDPQVRFFYNI